MKNKNDDYAFTVRLKGDLATKLQDYCDYSGCTKNSLVCNLIEEKLRDYKTAKEKEEERNYKYKLSTYFERNIPLF